MYNHFLKMLFTRAISVFAIIFALYLTFSHATNIDVINKCSYNIWPAWVSPDFAASGGTQLQPGQTWGITMQPPLVQARIWPRTGCKFDSGKGRCDTGDCNGELVCVTFNSGPSTAAEFARNHNTNEEFFYISTFDGFNVPMEYSGTCNKVTRCVAGDIIEQCPEPLKAKGGCNGLCRATRRCCNGSDCGNDPVVRYFEDKCPEAYTVSIDESQLPSCPTGSNYTITFCP